MSILASWRSTSAARNVVEATPADEKLSLPGIFCASAMKLLERLGGRIRRHDRHHRRRRHDAHPGKILDRIERHRLADRARDGVAVRGQHQRVAVLGGGRDAGGSRQAGTVLDDHLLFPHGGELVGQDAREPVGDAAGGERDDYPDGLRRIILRGRAAARRQQGRNAKSQCANSSHGVLSPMSFLAGVRGSERSRD